MDATPTSPPAGLAPDGPLPATEVFARRVPVSGAAVVAASPLFMGLLGRRYDEFTAQRPPFVPAVFIDRDKAAKGLADQAGLTLSQATLRFLLSMPQVNMVLTGAARPAEWADCAAAYEAGPSPKDLYDAIWRIAAQSPQPMCGG